MSPHPLTDALQLLPLEASTGVDVWQLELAHLHELDDTVNAQLSADERLRVKRFANPAQARLWAAIRACLRLLLARCKGCTTQEVEFSLGKHGKPASQGVSFNVSHSGSVGLIALSAEQPVQVGVDIETVSLHRDVMELAALVCTADEQAALSKLSDHELPLAFARMWSRKEAWLKAHGVGLGFGASRVNVGFEMPTRVVEVDGVPDTATLIDLPLTAQAQTRARTRAPEGGSSVDAYVGSLCILQPTSPDVG